MYEFLISNYIKNLCKNDIVYFALKNNISLNNQELDFVYHTLKNNYKILLSDDYELVFNEAKNYLTKENYEKTCNLFNDYRLKFKDYL